LVTKKQSGNLNTLCRVLQDDLRSAILLSKNMETNFQGVTTSGTWAEKHQAHLSTQKEAVAMQSLPGTAVEAVSKMGQQYIHQFSNTVASGHNNDCAQAAIATMVEFFGIGVHAEIPRNQHDSFNGRNYPDNEGFVDAIWRDYPTNAAFNWWTWKDQLKDALNGYGLRSGIGYAGAFGNGQEEWNNVYKWLQAGYPVVVLIDVNPILGKWGYHYTVLYNFDGTNVHLSNMGSHSSVPWNTFMEAWHCGSIPYPNNFVYITASR
jgi:hypothetical protein